jgi:taurine dioxygenase
MLENKTFTVNRLAGSLGAELSGLDLSRPLRPQDLAALRSAWLEHGVVFLRDQHLTSEQYMAFAQSVGTPVEYPFVKGIDGFPVIIEIKKLEHEKVNFGGVWHSDTAYLEQPPMATMLLAREIPPYGGDTMFSNQVQAYESLSDGMKRLLDGLVAVNTSAKADTTRTREDRLAEVGRTDANSQYEAEHPVVRTHPETGRKALYVNSAHTARFVGMTEEESAPLLQFLFAHQKKEEFTCRFRWQVGSIALWDNRCTHHFPINDYHGFRRLLHRITLAGDRPRH